MGLIKRQAEILWNITCQTTMRQAFGKSSNNIISENHEIMLPHSGYHTKSAAGHRWEQNYLKRSDNPHIALICLDYCGSLSWTVSMLSLNAKLLLSPHPKSRHCTHKKLTCSLVFMVSMGYKAVSTTTPAVPPAITPSAPEKNSDNEKSNHMD